MKKTRLEKGITLIALIITIVILLILAVVTIGAIREDSIIKHAQSSKEKYTIGDEKERIQLAHTEYVTAKYTPIDKESETIDNSAKQGLETFFLGKDIRTLVNEGKSTSEVYVVDYNENEEIKINTSDLKTSEDGKEVYVDFEYNGNTYRLTVDSSNFVSKRLEVMTLEKFFLGKNIDDLINDGKSTSEVLVIDYFGDEININIDELEINEAQTETYAYFDYEGIRYKLILDSNLIIQKLEAISKATELKVEGADVKGNEKTGWTIRFSDTGNRYTLNSDGTLSEPEKTIDLVEGSLAKAYVDGELAIGDTVAYTPETGKSITVEKEESGASKTITISTDSSTYRTSDLSAFTWQVMDVDDATGVVTLIASKSIKPIVLNLSNDYIVSGKAGYNGGPNVLNKLCSVFGTGKGATAARSLTVEDVNKVLKFDETKYEDSNNGKVNNDPVLNRRYGYQMTYYAEKTTWDPIDTFKFADGRKEYIRTGNDSVFTDINGNVATDEKPISLVTTDYVYTSNDVRVDRKIEEMMLGSNSSKDTLLASTSIETRVNEAFWGIREIYLSRVISAPVYWSNTTGEVEYTNVKSIRPVVELEANVLGEKDANGVWQLK